MSGQGERGAEEDRPGEPQAPAAALGPVAATLGGWLLLAVVNAANIALLPMPSAGVEVRALHHAHDAAQLVGGGIVSASAVALLRPLERRRPGLRYAAAAVVVTAASLLVVPADLAGFARRLAGAEVATLWLARAGAAAIAALVVAVLALGERLARSGRGAIGALAALALAGTNEVVLDGGYPGMHAMAAVSAVALFAGSVHRARVPRWLQGPRGRLVQGAAFALLACAGGWGLAVWPRSNVLVEMYKLDGAVVLPWAAALRGPPPTPDVAPLGPESWYATREGRPDLPPTAPPLVGPQPIVVLLTLDALRADVAADARGRPGVAALNEGCTRFTNARSVSPGTVVTIGSMFSGRYRSQLTWTILSSGVEHLDRDTNRRIPEDLTRAGVKTFHVVAYKELTRESGLTRGFEVERLLSPEGSQPFALSAPMLDEAVSLLKTAGDGPVFLFMHLMDAHSPYDSAGDAPTPFEAYAREVDLATRNVDAFRRAITADPALAQRTALIVTADHGEEFMEHGKRYHNGSLYDELLRVPLWVCSPAPPRVIDEPVSLIDLAPTLLDLFGQPTPSSFMGTSLVPYLHGRGERLERPLFAERFGMRAMVLGDYKVILEYRQNRQEIYDLAVDPGERRNLRDDLGVHGERLIATLEAFFAAHPPLR